MEHNLLRIVDELSRDLNEQKTREASASLTVATDNVASPPTDAELDTAFGTAANLPEGFMGVLDDNGAGTTVWFCVVSSNAWFYEQLTKAV